MYVYGSICRFLIELLQWAYNNSTAIWLALISNVVLLGSSILSKGSKEITLFLLLVTIIFVTILILKSITNVKKWLMKSYVRDRFDISRIAVLDGRISETDQSYHLPNNIQYLPQNWKDQLEVENLRVDLIPVSKISKKYSMIINPFGSHYIEEDFTNLKTFHKIKKFVHEGGVFVNTWNLAFWESWNSRENVKRDTSPGVEGYIFDSSPLSIEKHNKKSTQVILQPRILGNSLIDTLLYKNFGVHTTSFQSTMPLRVRPLVDYLQDIGERDITEFRAAINCEIPDMTFYKLFSARLERLHECYPIAAVNYYMGFLVLFGTAITSDSELNFECRVIKKIYDKLLSDGTLG